MLRARRSTSARVNEEAATSGNVIATAKRHCIQAQQIYRWRDQLLGRRAPARFAALSIIPDPPAALLAIAIARACIRAGVRGRFFNVVDLVNKLDAEARAGRQGRMADYLARMDFIILDVLGYCGQATVTST